MAGFRQRGNDLQRLGDILQRVGQQAGLAGAVEQDEGVVAHLAELPGDGQPLHQGPLAVVAASRTDQRKGHASLAGQVEQLDLGLFGVAVGDLPAVYVQDAEGAGPLGLAEGAQGLGNGALFQPEGGELAAPHILRHVGEQIGGERLERCQLAQIAHRHLVPDRFQHAQVGGFAPLEIHQFVLGGGHAGHRLVDPVEVGHVGKSHPLADLGDGVVGFLEQPLGVEHPQVVDAIFSMGSEV